MLTAVKLVDQWAAARTPPSARLGDRRAPCSAPSSPTSSPRPPASSRRWASVAPVTELVFTVRRAGGPAGPQAARRLFARLDAARIWCLLEQEDVSEAPPAMPVRGAASRRCLRTPGTRRWRSFPPTGPIFSARSSSSRARSFRAPRSSCAPLNPTRDRDRVGFTFRCAQPHGLRRIPLHGAAVLRAARPRGDRRTRVVLRVLSDTDNVATQGPVWYVGGKAL